MLEHDNFTGDLRTTKLSKDKDGQERQAEIAALCQTFISHCEASERVVNKLDRAATNQDFYRGAHWTEDEWNAYKGLGVTPITINRCLSQINALMGIYEDNKQDIIVRPRKSGTEAAARVWTEILKHAQDEAEAEELFRELLKTGSIQNEAYIEIEIDEFANPGGQIVINIHESLDVSVDPDANEYNLDKSAKFIIIKQWEDISYIEHKYKDVFGKSTSGTGMGDIERIVDQTYGDGHTEYDEETGTYRYKVHKVYWKEVVAGLAVYDQKRKQAVILKDPDKIKRAKEIAEKNPAIKVKDVPAFTIHKTIMINGNFAEDTIDPLGPEIQQYNVFRFSPHWNSGYALGVIDNIHNLNKEENINRTQATRYINQTVNSGWIVESDQNAEAVAQLTAYGSVNGVVLGKNKFGGSIDKIQPNKLPDANIFLGERSWVDIKEITGLNNAVAGYDTSKTESGRAIGLRMKQGTMTNSTILANFFKTIKEAGKFMLLLIRKKGIYTTEEIRAIVEESALIDPAAVAEAQEKLESEMGGGLMPPQPVMPPAPEVFEMIKPEDQAMVFDTIKSGIKASQLMMEKFPIVKRNYDEAVKQYAIELLIEDLKSDETAEYGLVVSTSPTSPTTRMANFDELMAIQDKYGVIPPDLFIEYSNLPNKKEIVARIRQAQQQQAQAQQQQLA